MVELKHLWQKRYRDNFQMQLRYWNLIGRNSGLMFFVYAMILIGGFYYKKWLDLLPAHFPGTLIVSLILTIVCVHAPIRTFIQRADLVFLLPVEAELDDYFRKSCLYSFLVQSVTLMMVWVISAPLYFQSTGQGSSAFFVGVVILLGAKGWNIACSWREQFIDDIVPLYLLRICLSFLFLYFALSYQSWFVLTICITVMLLAGFFLFHRQAAGALLRWQHLLESDTRQAMQFLRFANLFTDVPRLRRRTRPRSIISRMFPVRRFEEREVFKQIFIKTFVRSDDYLGMYVRLSVIGALLGYFLNMGYASVFIVISVIYLTGLQLLPIWSHPFPHALADLYPVPEKFKDEPFVRMVMTLLVAQSVLLSGAAALGARSFVGFILFLCSGIIVSVFFSTVYTKRRIRLKK